MANEYGTLAELKEMRNISPAVTSQDEALTKALIRASRAIDRRLGRRFYRDGIVSTRKVSPYGRTLRSRCSETLLVEDIADESTVSVSLAGSSLSSVSYAPRNPGEPITGIISTSWYGGDILITAEWGWPAVPPDIEQAALLLANRRYMRKDSPEGTSGWSQEGSVGVSRFDSDIEDLLQPFFIPGFGA